MTATHYLLWSHIILDFSLLINLSVYVQIFQYILLVCVSPAGAMRTCICFLCFLCPNFLHVRNKHTTATRNAVTAVTMSLAYSDFL